ncbi:MAG: hypothetical protein II038_07205, partial [Lachnospiraceae bacterium]|nr:hypothetical protein [Lachnospiraceae bacterium]
MKKTILTKAVSLVLCASMAVSFAACAASGTKETEEETTLISKPENDGTTETSEETSETTPETTAEATTEASTEATTMETTAPKVNP